MGNFQWPINRPKTSEAEAEDGLLKSFEIMFGFGHSLIVTSAKKGPKLNSSPVYFSGLKSFQVQGYF